jgi:hypothetical protein
VSSAQATVAVGQRLRGAPLAEVRLGQHYYVPTTKDQPMLREATQCALYTHTARVRGS